jgi:dimethylargininase
MFTRAIVKRPAKNFADGLTTVDFGVPVWERVVEQYEAYCAALVQCGLALTRLEADDRFPDSTFVEDTAVITERGAILMRPGAASREGEVAAMKPVLEGIFGTMPAIEAPGSVDGGDICEAGEHFFIGLSHRTNEEGARQLAEHLKALGYTSSTVDVRMMTSILHLKSGIAWIGERTLVVMEEMAGREEFLGWDLLRVSTRESYAANCVRVNDRVLIAKGYEEFEGDLNVRGFAPLALEMSEFRKMDGGLSCLSLRF